jgi:hypothetical protein
MELRTTQRQILPTDSVFVEDFRVFYSDDGLRVAIKSKPFAKFVQGISKWKEPKPLSSLSLGPLPMPFDVDPDHKIWIAKSNLIEEPNSTLSCLYLNEEQLIIREARVGANLAFLLFDGVEKGIEFGIKTPVPVSYALDYYHACIQGFQAIYMEWIRPFSLSAKLEEVQE